MLRLMSAGASMQIDVIRKEQ